MWLRNWNHIIDGDESISELLRNWVDEIDATEIAITISIFIHFFIHFKSILSCIELYELVLQSHFNVDGPYAALKHTIYVISKLISLLS